MRTYKEAEQAGRTAGMKLVDSRDIATASPVAGPWWAAHPVHLSCACHEAGR